MMPYAFIMHSRMISLRTVYDEKKKNPTTTKSSSMVKLNGHYAIKQMISSNRYIDKNQNDGNVI